MDRERGKRLHRYIHERMARYGFKTQEEVWAAAGIGRDTGQAWLRGSRAPTPAAGAKLAGVFGETYFDLLRALDGGGSDLDDQTLIAAFEWAIQQVRGRRRATTGQAQVPPEVAEAVESAERALGETQPQPQGSHHSRPESVE